MINARTATAKDFDIAAHQHANAFWLWLIISIVVGYLLGWWVEVVSSLKAQYPRIEEVTDDLNWTLQKNPFLGTIIEQSATCEIRVIHTMGMGETPAFWVLVEIDKKKEEVTLMALRPLAESQND